MRVLEREYGLRPISFDEHLRDPDGTRMRLQLWLRGAGDPSAEAGMHTVAVNRESTAARWKKPVIRSMAALTHCGKMATSRTTWRDSARTHGSRDMNGMWTD